MKVINAETGVEENLRATKRFMDDIMEAARKSGLTSMKDLKKFMAWYKSNYARLHIKKTAGRYTQSGKVANRNEGCNLAKLAGYLCKKIGKGRFFPTCSLGHQFFLLKSEGTLANGVYEDYFAVAGREDHNYLADGVLVVDWCTYNIKRFEIELMQVLTELEGEQLVATFIKEPWLHVSKETNWRLWEMLVAKAKAVCEEETGLKLKEFYVRKKVAVGKGMEVRMHRKGSPISDPLPAVPIVKCFGGNPPARTDVFSCLD